MGVRDTPNLSTKVSSAIRDPAGKSPAKIISRKRSGYLARYEFDQARDLVLVARTRHQRESGYSEGEI